MNHCFYARHLQKRQYIIHYFLLNHGMLAVLPVKNSPVLRDWHCVHTLEKTLSPAAEAFRQFILTQGQNYLAHEFGALLGDNL